MITDFSRYAARKTWQLGDYDYTSPAQIGAGAFGVFREQINRAIIAIGMNIDIPDEKLDPEGHRNAMSLAIKLFVEQYPEAAYLVICDTILTPVSGSPAVEDVVREIETTERGIVQIASVANFFLSVATTNMSDVKLLPKNGHVIATGSKANPLRTTVRKRMKSGS